MQCGLARFVEKIDAGELKAPGSIVRATVSDATSAVIAGYDDTLPAYYAGARSAALSPAGSAP